MFEISGKRKELVNTTGHLLVMGGPGSGKTTIALLKANHVICSGLLGQGQRILFLSFARATISRVEQHAKGILNECDTSLIEISTYHSFAWTILKSHGYLLIPHRIRLLPPHEATVRLSSFATDARKTEKTRLFDEEGLLHFDLFAEKCADLLKRSTALSSIFAATYPIIILDEFQDTNLDEWELISHLGKRSTLVTLADPYQRIYDFRGADPKRVEQFITEFCPAKYDFEMENNRSHGTDIVDFGNDLLTGRNKGRKYNDVEIQTYKPLKGYAHLFKIKMYVAKKLRENRGNTGWSLAILTPTNNLMKMVSDYFGKQSKRKAGGITPSVPHDVSLDPSGPAIAAIALAKLLELASQRKLEFPDVIIALCEHILGRRGDDDVPKPELELSKAITAYINVGDYSKGIRGTTRNAIIAECKRITEACNATTFTGGVEEDWAKVREVVSIGTTECVKKLYQDLMSFRLFRRGSALNSTLALLWRNNGHYDGASEAVRNAITQEHFAMSSKTWSGVNIMTIHKAKGKEFDEVIIIEGANNNRLVFKNNLKIARLNLRVAATRAKSKVIILTPAESPCPLL